MSSRILLPVKPPSRRTFDSKMKQYQDSGLYDASAELYELCKHRIPYTNNYQIDSTLCRDLYRQVDGYDKRTDQQLSRNEAQKVIDLLQEALFLFNLTPFLIGMIHSIMGRLCMQHEEFDKAVECFLLAMFVRSKSDRKEHLLDMAQDLHRLAMCYIFAGDLNEGLRQLKMVDRHYRTYRLSEDDRCFQHLQSELLDIRYIREQKKQQEREPELFVRFDKLRRKEMALTRTDTPHPNYRT